MQLVQREILEEVSEGQGDKMSDFLLCGVCCLRPQGISAFCRKNKLSYTSSSLGSSLGSKYSDNSDITNL